MRTIVIWAGSDVFSFEKMQELDDPQAMYEQVSERMMPTLIETFGSGVELRMENLNSFRVNVDHVEIS